MGPIRKSLIAGGALASAALLTPMLATQSAALDATWQLNPTVAGPTAGTFDFNTDANWSSPATTPTGTAFFGASNHSDLSFSNAMTIGGWTFLPGASAYTFTDRQFAGFTGAGIVINGGSTSIATVFMQFFNSSTAGSASITTITNNGNLGELDFFNSSTAGSATITNNGTLTFFNQSTAGTSRITNNAGGVIDLSIGTSKFSLPSVQGAGSIYLGPTELTLGGDNLSSVISGVISNCGPHVTCRASNGGGFGRNSGSIVKTGAGTLALSGINTYTGATTVSAGILQVDGSIVASSGVTVNASGILAGSGEVSSAVINNSGALQPGSPGTPGTLTVQGSLALASAALYVVQASPTAVSRITVNGTATINGSVLATFATGTYKAGTYTILSATGGVSGTFSSVGFLGNISGARNPHLAYDANDVFLVLDPNTISPSLSPNANTNQRGVAAAIDAAIVAGTNPGGGFNALLNLQGGPLGAALTQASGETATGSQQTTFDAMTMFMGMMTDPFNAGRTDGGAGATPFTDEGKTSSYASTQKSGATSGAHPMFTKAMPIKADPFAQRWGVWGAGFGGSQTTDGKAALGSSNALSRIGGVAAGADYRFSPYTMAGFALAGGTTNFSVINGGSGRSDLFQVGAFMRHMIGPTYISAALAYGWQDITTDRTVTIAGVDQLRAKFNANAYSGRIEGGYRFVLPWMGGVGITPYAAGQFATFDLPAYAEQAIVGAKTFALAYAAKSVAASRSELGLRSDKSYALGDAVLTLRGRTAWAHDYNTDRSIAATFQTLPGASFVVNGAQQSRDKALTTAAAEMKFISGVSFAATFEGEFSDVTRSYAGKGAARYQW
jgi:autotransporter-associated beta strand protein